jgi:hypothetical protein
MELGFYRRILVVEDESLSATLVRVFLGELGRLSPSPGWSPSHGVRNLERSRFHP